MLEVDKGFYKRTDLFQAENHWFRFRLHGIGDFFEGPVLFQGPNVKKSESADGNIESGPRGGGAVNIYNSSSLSRTATGRIGDIVYWSKPYNHVAIFAGNSSVWSARSTKSGKPFGIYPMSFFGNGSQPSYLISPQVCK